MKGAWGIYMKSDIDYAASRCGPSWSNTANEVAAAIRARGNE